jgi:hypothetical protein
MASLESWIDGILFTLLAVGCFSLIIAGFNLTFSKGYSSPFSDSSGSEQLFIDYQDSAVTQIQGGEATFDASQGITLKSSWGLIKDAASLVGNFFTGGFIENTAASLHLGAAGMAFAKVMRILFVMSMIFAVVYALFKVVV